jgi:hypothetical protein
VGAECGDIVSGLFELSLFCLHIPRTSKVMGGQVGERGRRLRRVGAWSNLVEFEMRRTTAVPDLRQLVMVNIIKCGREEERTLPDWGGRTHCIRKCEGGIYEILQ